MSDDPKKPRSSLAVWLIAAAMLLPAYVVSIGPAAWLVKHEHMSPELFGAIYQPVILLTRNATFLRPVFNWWGEWWYG